MRSLFRVLRHPSYSLLSVFITWLTLTAILYVPNRLLLVFGLGIDGVSYTDKAWFVLGFYQSLLSNFTLVSASVTVFIAVLFGLTVTLLVYYIRLMRGSSTVVHEVEALSIAGLISGFFGIGCAVCGSVILTSLLSLFGASGLLLFLPLHGEEFSFIAVGLLLYALWVLTKRIDAPRVC